MRYEKSGASRELDRGVTIHIYRVMQEALNNIAKHSQSTQAAVRLRYLPEAVVLEVEDNGVGFAKFAGPWDGAGFHARASGSGERPPGIREMAARRGPGASYGAGSPEKPASEETHA